MDKDLLNHILKVEADGESYYKEFARLTKTPELKAVFEALAKDEQEHAKLFQRMFERADIGFEPGEAPKAAKTVFETLKATKAPVKASAETVDLYKEAREVEKKNRDFYREQAKAAEDPKFKTLLMSVSDEEHRHYQILENIIMYLEAPETSLENPEWAQIDGY